MKRFVTLLAALAALLMLAGPALAVDPPTLTGPVVDQTGKLDGGDARIAAAAAALKAERGIDYYVVFLPSLDGEDPSSFIDRTAAANGLTGKKAAMLLVSLNDRKIALWSSAANAVSNSELDQIRETQVVPKLKSGDFIGATEVAATGIAKWDATDAAPVPQVAQPTFTAPSIDWGIVGGGLLIIIAGILLVIAFGYAARFVVRRNEERQREREAIEKMEALAKNARLTLIKADEQVRDSEQELAFAEAEFGSEELAPFRATLETAKTEMQAAFRIGAQIEDDDPESYEERQSMFESIVSSTKKITSMLSKQESHIDALRKTEETAAETVKQLTLDSKTRKRSLTAAEGVLDKLALHGQSVHETVAHNLDVARARFDQTDGLLSEAQAALDTGVRAKAALLIREANSAIAEGKANLDAIVKLGDSLDEAEKNLEAELATAVAEIGKAESSVKAQDVTGLGGDLASARKALKSAQTEFAKPDADFIVAYQLATSANQYADRVLDGVRSEVDRRQRAVEQAEAQLRQAKQAIEQADAYITSHRSTVGRKARTRLSEAQRQYQQATVGTLDVFQAAAIAIAANTQASEAYSAARQDVSSASSSSYGYGYGSSSSSSYGSSSSGGSYGSSSSSSSSSYGSSSSSSDWGSSSSSDSFSIGSFGGGGGGSSSGGGW